MFFRLLVVAFLSTPFAALAGTDGHGSDDVSRYLNLIKLYILPDILTTVKPENVDFKKNEDIKDVYIQLYDSLLGNSDVLTFKQSSNLKDKHEGLPPWILTSEGIGSPLQYDSVAYSRHFHDNFDVINITEHVFHEMGHWFPQLSEDKAWQLAYLVVGAYQAKCESTQASILSTGGCQAYSLVKRAEVKDGKPTYATFRKIEKIEGHNTCLEDYYQSVRKLTNGISAQGETVDMALISSTNKGKILLILTWPSLQGTFSQPI